MGIAHTEYSATKKQFAVDWSSLRVNVEVDTMSIFDRARYTQQDLERHLFNLTTTTLTALWYRKQKDKDTREGKGNAHTTSVFYGEILPVTYSTTAALSSKQEVMDLTEEVALFPLYRLTEHGKLVKYAENVWEPVRNYAGQGTLQSTFSSSDLQAMTSMHSYLDTLISNPGTFPSGYDGWLALS